MEGGLEVLLDVCFFRDAVNFLLAILSTYANPPHEDGRLPLHFHFYIYLGCPYEAFRLLQFAANIGGQISLHLFHFHRESEREP